MSIPDMETCCYYGAHLDGLEVGLSHFLAEAKKFNGNRTLSDDTITKLGLVGKDLSVLQSSAKEKPPSNIINEAFDLVSKILKTDPSRADRPKLLPEDEKLITESKVAAFNITKNVARGY